VQRPTTRLNLARSQMAGYDTEVDNTRPPKP
jgi:hypothetical protein